MTEQAKKLVSILAIPFLLFVTWTTSLFLKSETTLLSFTNILLFYVIYIFIIFLHKEFLKKDWASFKTGLWKKILLCILGAASAHVLLAAVRMFLPPVVTSGSDASSETTNLAVILLTSFVPLLAAVIEEIIFRHLLFYQIKNSLLKWIMFLVSAILFGGVHYINFDGNLVQTIPYMVIASYFSLIYQFSKNIWWNISVHLIFNSLQFWAAIFLIVAQYVV